ncbi:LysM peptidoglycan-binding domain-containing protein [bacterium]|nr:MAG: LysM peptidoglycan-binding domain-containing protein [bacterium]
MVNNRSKRTRKTKRSSFRRNLKPSLLLLLLPLLVGGFVIFLIATGIYSRNLSDLGSKRLVTENWQSAVTSIKKTQPDYAPKFAYYKVKPGQTIESIAAFYSVNIETLKAMNPGMVVPGTTLKIPPLEAPLAPTAGANGLITQAVVSDDAGMLRVTNKYGTGQQVVTTIPELMTFLRPYNAIEQTGPTTYRLLRALSLDGDIRLDMTKTTLTKLELRSSPKDITCLCLDQGSALIQDVEITSIDPATGKQDTSYEDGRSFLRAKNGRMDIINSSITYLGNALDGLDAGSGIYPSLKEGGVYGASWRISSDTLGQNIATGWVEKSTFDKNHFGAYTFGASGMMWKSNTFTHNDIYGLDPHDDSNNATIENNVFAYNGKHGFIVSKRCNYNIIRNNVSYDNKYHGFMLHKDSAYNVIEDNTSFNNMDNFVIYESNYNTIRNNKSYNPQASHIRINKPSHNNFVTGNELYGGSRGVYLYEGTSNTLVSGNQIHGVRRQLQTNGASNTVFANNTVDAIKYDIGANDRMVFGENTVDKREYTVIDPTAAARKVNPSYTK